MTESPSRVAPADVAAGSSDLLLRYDILNALGPKQDDDVNERKWRDFLALVEASDIGRTFDEGEIVRITQYKRFYKPLLQTLQLRRAGHDVLVYDLEDPGTALFRAASNPNPAILKAVLSAGEPKCDPSAWDEGTTPLRTAITARLSKNVRLLLEHGADPNGCTLSALSNYSARFLRFRPDFNSSSWLDRSTVLHEIKLDGFPEKDAPLTDGEIEERRQNRAVFWAEVDIPPEHTLDTWPEPLSLQVAAATGDQGIVDILLAAQPDTQAWLQYYDKMPPNPTASFLSPSTPLHAALGKGNISMAKYLASRGFSVNAFPPASVASCLNPIMAAIALAQDKISAYDALAPFADHALRSKIFNVHILHLAIATHDLQLIHRVEAVAPLSSAGTTALNHTLLHIACLPRNESQINSRSKKIHQSIHDVRLSPRLMNYWDPSDRPPPFVPRSLFKKPTPAASDSESDKGESSTQLATVSYLVSSIPALDVLAQDIHGNTALHYLASCRTPNNEAIELLQAASMAGDSWTTTRNHWGFTAEDLFIDGKDALNKGDTPKKREWKRKRDRITQEDREEPHIPTATRPRTPPWRRRIPVEAGSGVGK